MSTSRHRIRAARTHRGTIPVSRALKGDRDRALQASLSLSMPILPRRVYMPSVRGVVPTSNQPGLPARGNEEHASRPASSLGHTPVHQCVVVVVGAGCAVIMCAGASKASSTDTAKLHAQHIVRATHFEPTFQAHMHAHTHLAKPQFQQGHKEGSERKVPKAALLRDGCITSPDYTQPLFMCTPPCTK